MVAQAGGKAASTVLSRLGEVVGDDIIQGAYKMGKEGLQAIANPMKSLGNASAGWLERGAAMGAMGGIAGAATHVTTGLAAMPLQMAGVGSSDLSIGGALGAAATGATAGFALGAFGFKKGAMGLEARSGVQKLMNLAGDIRGPMSESAARALPGQSSIKSLWEGSRQVVSDSSYNAVDAAKKAMSLNTNKAAQAGLKQDYKQAVSQMEYQGIRGSGFNAREGARQLEKEYGQGSSKHPLLQQVFKEGKSDSVINQLKQKADSSYRMNAPANAQLGPEFYENLAPGSTKKARGLGVLNPDGSNAIKANKAINNAIKANKAINIARAPNKGLRGEEKIKANQPIKQEVDDALISINKKTLGDQLGKDINPTLKAKADYEIKSNKALQHETGNTGIQGDKSPSKFRNLIGKQALSTGNLGAGITAGGLGMSMYQTNALGVYVPSNRGYR